MKPKDPKENEVTVYSCSGCSNVAQMANSVAVKLHRSKIARMSCIAGVGGDVPSLVKTAERAEKILAIDGCPLACVSNCLKRHNITSDVHIVLTENGLTKNTNDEVPEEKIQEFFEEAKKIVQKLKDEN